MFDQQQEKVIALSAMFMASCEIARLAREGICDNINFRVLVDSLFQFEPDSTLAVYDNDLSRLRDGLTLLSSLSNKSLGQDYAETVRYTLNLIALEKATRKQPDMLKVIRSRLEHMRFSQEHFNQNERDLTEKVSALYQDTLSTLRFRVQVTGNMDHLTQPQISDKIRTLLMAGLRATFLWRQLGGSKWQLILGRNKIEQSSKQLLDMLSTNTH